ncbi:MAG: hypothetical protein ACM3W7_05225, partial [Acidobacteriota bacterium]
RAMPPLALQRAPAKSKWYAAAGCILGLVMFASSPARAGDGDDTAPDVKFLQNLLQGLGLERPDMAGNGIEYQERSPLVIPPDRSLPPPETASAKPNPNWPVDPEIKRAKARKAARLARGMSDTAEMEREANPLRPDELDKGPRVNSPRDAGAMSPEESAKPFKPSQLGYKGGIFGSLFGKNESEQAATFTGEPPRTSLTEPPPGYQTPSPNQPYAAGKEVNRPKAYDFKYKHGTEEY